MKMVKLPCDKLIEAQDSVPDHLVIEGCCMDGCRYMSTCGRFWDWFNKNHRAVGDQDAVGDIGVSLG